jgi:predicted kinase
MDKKATIKNILREGTEKNSLGVIVTRPNQELIVMRGIPGGGKSTKAKTLVGQGVIHSTDDLIEKSGDYNEFFAKMIATQAAEEVKRQEAKKAGKVYVSNVNAFAPLSKMHAQNVKDAIASLKAGKSPVIIDNTNIKLNEPKAIVVAALEMGLADNNIKFVDIGTAGLEAADLAKRNSHGVPLEKIEQMIAAHTGQGEMTLKKVLDAKDMYKASDVKYSAVVLDTASKTRLLEFVGDKIPQGWKVFAHHMTINMGPLKDKSDIGKNVTLSVTALGLSDMAMAVKVEGYPSKNAIPHVTVAVSPSGKPVMSNEITKWQDIKRFNLMGTVTEVK